jgi:hypothetical protein
MSGTAILPCFWGVIARGRKEGGGWAQPVFGHTHVDCVKVVKTHQLDLVALFGDPQ